MNNKIFMGLFRSILFGNYFYGLCAIALSVEATLQQRKSLNGLPYFAFIFLATVLYYTYPYVRRCSCVSANIRTNWYSRNYRFVWLSQIAITIVLAITVVGVILVYPDGLLRLSWQGWTAMLLFPLAAALYYGSRLFNLRRIGWLKPFLIGFTWAGVVTVYPVVYNSVVKSTSFAFSLVGCLLFLKNLVFIALLCVMFDIKDYATDCFGQLKTFVVKMGLRKTIFFLLAPLTAAGLVSFLIYAVAHHFSAGKIGLNLLPFLCLAGVAFSLRKRRSIIYYLFVVDGLMIVKAICGSLAITCCS